MAGGGGARIVFRFGVMYFARGFGGMPPPPENFFKMVQFAGAYAGFFRGGPNLKILGIFGIHVASSEAASRC